ncbi:MULTISPECIES: hypothetical protein [Brachybacterium]|uniref:hypothetical protein n=1 Tax=Brachybacterium TaxID=43668 RepID=UPI0006B54FD6|nr:MULTISPECIES: hypothetical protein [Brachybacterium]GAP77909.1 hypothetical protein Y09_0727 [Brachybacterium sp. SW0106-09]
MRARYPRYYAQKDLLDAAESVVAGYHRAVAGGTPVSLTHSSRDPDLPDESVQVTVSDEQLLLTVEEWLGCLELVESYVMSWVSARVHLEGAKDRAGRGRVEPFWYEAIRRANPGRR